MSAIFDRVLTVNLIANTAIFYVAARLFLLPLVPRSTATNSCSHPPLAFNATSGTDVPHPRRHFPGNAAAVCVSGRIWRSDNGHTCIRSNSARVAQLWFGQAGGMGFQYFWNPGPARSNHVCHDLQCASDNGTGVLDSGFLGSVVVGDPLRDLCSSWSSLAALSRCNCSQVRRQN